MNESIKSIFLILKKSWNPIVNVTITVEYFGSKSGNARVVSSYPRGPASASHVNKPLLLAQCCLYGDFCSWDCNVTNKSPSIITVNENNLLKFY